MDAKIITPAEKEIGCDIELSALMKVYLQILVAVISGTETDIEYAYSKCDKLTIEDQARLRRAKAIAKEFLGKN